MLINTICQHLATRIENGELRNHELVQLIELIGSYLNIQTMKILYNYIQFPSPLKARYIQTGNNYIIDEVTGLMSWSKIEVETIVIGEDDTCYIEYLKEHRICDTAQPDYGKIVLMPIGFHKSRLVKWLGPPVKQLSLFH